MGQTFELGQDPEISAEANAAVLAIFNDANDYPKVTAIGYDDDGALQTTIEMPADNIAAPEPESPAGDPPATCFCGDPLNEKTWCGCAEGLRRLERRVDGRDDCDQGDDEYRPEDFRGMTENRPSDADLGQLASTQDWYEHQQSMNRIFDTQ